MATLMETDEAIKIQSDWLLDAIATATQNRMFLRGDPECDSVACEAIISNARKAMGNLLSVEFENIRIALGGYKDSDLVSLATTLGAQASGAEYLVEGKDEIFELFVKVRDEFDGTEYMQGKKDGLRTALALLGMPEMIAFNRGNGGARE